MEPIIDPRLLTPKIPVSELTWRLWEKKNLNIHRGVVEWVVDQEFESINEIALRIRDGVKTEFRPGWLRGFGFGTVLHFKSLSKDFDQICGHIDTRNKKNGVWQWAILQFDESKVAVGIHTWLSGYLRPVYDSILARLKHEGYECHTAEAEVDQLIAILQKIQSLSPTHLVISAATSMLQGMNQSRATK